MKIELILTYLLFLTAGISCSSGSGLYVDSTNGDDSNSGSIRKPLKTISEASERIRVSPENIFLAAEQEFDGTLILENIDAAENSEITIESYGKGRAVINGGKRSAILINNCNNIHIRNLDLRGDGRKNGNSANGLGMTRCTGCVIENLIAGGFLKSGVDLYNCHSVEIRKVLARENGFCGINVMGSSRDSSGNILIKNCKAENNPGDPTILDNHSGNGILVGVSANVTVDHCSATGNGWDMPRLGNGPVGIWTWMSDHVTIQYCISYRNRTSRGGKDGGGFDLDGGVTNSIIQYCLSYENEGAGFGLFQYPGASDWAGNVVRYCVSINDAGTTEGAGSFFIWNGSGDSSQLTGCYIYNNVVFNKKAPLISFEDASAHEDFKFANNIFVGTGQMIIGKNTGTTFVSNVWWNTMGHHPFRSYDTSGSWVKSIRQFFGFGWISSPL